MTRSDSSSSHKGTPKKKRHRPESVHVSLSKNQRAYSVFQPASYDDVPLFQIIFVLSDPDERSDSPRATVVNLKHIFEGLQSDPHEDKSFIKEFIDEFEDTESKEQDRLPEILTVSKESLLSAGIKLSPVPPLRVGLGGSGSSNNIRKIRLQYDFVDVYKGGPKLQTLIWRHAQLVFRHIIEALHFDDYFPSDPLDRGLLAIVTKDIVSFIDVLRSTETRMSGGANAGDPTGTVQGGAGVRFNGRSEEDYQNLYGVSGLHFIVFPIESIGDKKWRIHMGVSVCDRDIDDSFSETTRERSKFSRAKKWLLGQYQFPDGSDSKDVPTSQTMHMATLNQISPTLFREAAQSNEDTEQQDSPLYVDISPKTVPVPWIEVDIKPFLIEVAQSQCRLASYYRKAAPGDIRKLTYAVCLLRSALRKHCFESTVRALYDLAGCYLRGVGIVLDFGTAKLLRLCASGFRRCYDSRAVWLSRLAVEGACYPEPTFELRVVSLLLFSRRTLTSLALKLDDSCRSKSSAWKTANGDRAERRDGRTEDPTGLQSFGISYEQKEREETSHNQAHLRHFKKEISPKAAPTTNREFSLPAAFPGTSYAARSPTTFPSPRRSYRVFTSHTSEDTNERIAQKLQRPQTTCITATPATDDPKELERRFTTTQHQRRYDKTFDKSVTQAGLTSLAQFPSVPPPMLPSVIAMSPEKKNHVMMNYGSVQYNLRDGLRKGETGMFYGDDFCQTHAINRVFVVDRSNHLIALCTPQRYMCYMANQMYVPKDLRFKGNIFQFGGANVATPRWAMRAAAQQILTGKNGELLRMGNMISVTGSQMIDGASKQPEVLIRNVPYSGASWVIIDKWMDLASKASFVSADTGLTELAGQFDADKTLPLVVREDETDMMMADPVYGLTYQDDRFLALRETGEVTQETKALQFRWGWYAPYRSSHATRIMRQLKFDEGEHVPNLTNDGGPLKTQMAFSTTFVHPPSRDLWVIGGVEDVHSDSVAKHVGTHLEMPDMKFIMGFGGLR